MGKMTGGSALIAASKAKIRLIKANNKLSKAIAQFEALEAEEAKEDGRIIEATDYEVK